MESVPAQDVLARDREELEHVRLSSLRALLSEHTGTVLTLTYLVMSLIGLRHQALVMSAFRVDFAASVEPSDIFLAAVRDPFVVLSALVPAVAFYVLLGLYQQRSAARRPERYAKSRAKYPLLTNPRVYLVLQALSALLWASSFLSVYSARKVEAIRNGVGRKYAVALTGDGAPRRPLPPDSALIVAVTSKHMVLYFHTAHEVRVVPHEQIVSISVSRPVRTRPLPRVVRWIFGSAAPVDSASK